MRKEKRVNDYAVEIHRILREKHNTDIPKGAISHILDITTRRIIEGLSSYRYIKIHPFYFYFRLEDFKFHLKKQQYRKEILEALKEIDYPGD